MYLIRNIGLGGGESRPVEDPLNHLSVNPPLNIYGNIIFVVGSDNNFRLTVPHHFI